jgi:hypothetical protein
MSSGIPTLSDGTPLTFEWLNLVAQTVNRLDASNNDDSNVKFDGDIKGDDILVVTGTVPVVVSAKEATGPVIKKPNIKFPVTFANANVTVIAMVTSTAAKQNDKPIAAGVAVGQITANNFDAVIQLFADEADFGKKKFQLKYVAIGKKKS